MTGPDDDMTVALARTLRNHAAAVSLVDGLAEKAVAIASRRRRRRIHASIAAIVVLAVGVPVAVVAAVDDSRPSVAHEVDPRWRWESYRGVQLQVPPDWVYGVPGQAWCAAPAEGTTQRVAPGAVGRPADIAAIACPSEYPPVDQRENWLTFDSRNQVGERPVDHGWVEETRRVKGVFVTIFSNDAALRAAILGSVQPIVGADQYGCPIDHPVAADPDGYRPDADEGGLPPADTVESISVCRYALAAEIEPPLLSSGRLAGAAAKDIVDAIRSAPRGEGPDVENADPGNDGTEIAVLRIDTADGVREVVVRYSGESGNGFDDGTTKRRLTADAIRPLLTGANSPKQFFLPVAMLFSN